MHPEEIKAFRELVADPIEQKVYDAIELQDGMSFIDRLEVFYLDGRNCGHDSRMVAYGLKVDDGTVTPFEHEAYDMSLKEFLSNISSPFISNGIFTVEDEINPIEIKTNLCLSAKCSAMFSELECLKDATFLGNSHEYEKMVHILANNSEDEPSMEMNM